MTILADIIGCTERCGFTSTSGDQMRPWVCTNGDACMTRVRLGDLGYSELGALHAKIVIGRHISPIVIWASRRVSSKEFPLDRALVVVGGGGVAVLALAGPGWARTSRVSVVKSFQNYIRENTTGIWTWEGSGAILMTGNHNGRYRPPTVSDKWKCLE